MIHTLSLGNLRVFDIPSLPHGSKDRIYKVNLAKMSGSHDNNSCSERSDLQLLCFLFHHINTLQREKQIKLLHLSDLLAKNLIQNYTASQKYWLH